MVKKFLITRPNYDVVTSYLYDFTKETVKTLKKVNHIHVTSLEESRVKRKNLEKCLDDENPSLVNLNGHGDDNSVCGHKEEVIFDEKNVKLSNGKIIYSLTCNSASKLGDMAIKSNAKAYIGYTAPFMLVTDPSRQGNPAKDRNALPFRRVCVMLLNSLIDGQKVKSAVDKAKEEYRQLIRSYGTSEDDPYGDAPLIRFALAWNLEFLEAKGDPNACF